MERGVQQNDSLADSYSDQPDAAPPGLRIGSGGGAWPSAQAERSTAEVVLPDSPNRRRDCLSAAPPPLPLVGVSTVMER